MNTKYLHMTILSLSLFFLMDCAPITSDMQSAKTVGQGGIEASLNSGGINQKTDASDTDGSDGDISLAVDDKVQENIGGSIAYGVNDRLDLRVRYESIDLPLAVEAVSASMLSLGVKYAIIEDNLALFLPYSMYNFDDDSTESVETLSPTVLYTHTIQEKYEVTPSLKYVIPLGDIADDNDPGIAFNLGFGYLLNDKVTFRGEWGQWFPADNTEDSKYTHTTLGLTYKIK